MSAATPKGTVEVDPVVLHMDVDDELLATDQRRLKALAA
jgi:hypothetical protein